MIEKGKEYRISDETFDKIIKKGIETEMNDGKDIITDEELLAMGYTLPPDDIPERIKKERGNNQRLRNRKPALIRKLLVAVAALVILLATMSVSGVRVYVFNIVSEIRQNSIQFFGTNKNVYHYDVDEGLAYENAEKECGFPLLKPGYLPEGFVFERVKVYADDQVVMYYEGNGKTIKLIQRLLTGATENGSMIDTLEGDIYTFTSRGIKVTASEYERKDKGEKWYAAVWNDEKMMYKADGSCTKDEFEKFIKKLK